jgi:hypothetical protein
VLDVSNITLARRKERDAMKEEVNPGLKSVIALLSATQNPQQYARPGSYARFEEYLNAATSNVEAV